MYFKKYVEDVRIFYQGISGFWMCYIINILLINKINILFYLLLLNQKLFTKLILILQ